MYWSPVLRYAQQLGLPAPDAKDVLQETMVTLIQKLPGFSYDASKGKFRNFLLTIVHRKALAALRRAGKRQELSLDAGGGDDAPPLLDQMTDAAAVHPAAPDSELWQRTIYEEALQRIQRDPEVQPQTLEVFQAYVVMGEACADVAARFGLKENAVYQIKNRLLHRLKQEVALLARGCGADYAP